MDTPGITIRPIRNIDMGEEFCEVFFDNVRVPLGNLVGEIDRGWTMAKALLSFERICIGSPRQSTYAMEPENPRRTRRRLGRRGVPRPLRSSRRRPARSRRALRDLRRTRPQGSNIVIASTGGTPVFYTEVTINQLVAGGFNANQANPANSTTTGTFTGTMTLSPATT